MSLRKVVLISKVLPFIVQVKAISSQLWWCNPVEFAEDHISKLKVILTNHLVAMKIQN